MNNPAKTDTTRYWILCLIFSVAVINYIDRQAFSVAAPVIHTIWEQRVNDIVRKR